MAYSDENVNPFTKKNEKNVFRLSCQTASSCHARRVLSGIQSLFFPGEDGFPLKTCGNDKGGRREGQEGQRPLSVMPDGCYRASRVFFLFPVKMDSR